jgi:hypothetical protein
MHADVTTPPAWFTAQTTAYLEAVQIPLRLSCVICVQFQAHPGNIAIVRRT